MKNAKITSKNKLKFKYEKKSKEIIGPLNKLELVLAKINNEIHQDEFNELIMTEVDLREITKLATYEKINNLKLKSLSSQRNIDSTERNGITPDPI